MNIKTAAKETQRLVLDACIWPLKPEKLGRSHIVYMLDQIIEGKVTDEKAHRWLGWAQAACVHAGAAELEHMKEINHAA